MSHPHTIFRQPADEKREWQAEARKRKVSLAQLIRQAVRKELGNGR